jgi:anaphase-promoting complex subunit 10
MQVFSIVQRINRQPIHFMSKALSLSDSELFDHIPSTPHKSLLRALFNISDIFINYTQFSLIPSSILPYIPIFIAVPFFAVCSNYLSACSFIAILVLHLYPNNPPFPAKMPSRRRLFNPRAPRPYRINPNHRIKRVPLGELPFQKTTGALLCERIRTIRPLPVWEDGDKENEEAFMRAVDHIDATLDQQLADLRNDMEQAEEIRHSIDYFLAAPPVDGPRLSMPPVDSDGSSSEPDESILQNRGRVLATPAGPPPQVPSPYTGNRAVEQEVAQEALSPEEYEDENSIDEDDMEDEEEDIGDQDQALDVAPPFDPATAGLKEISNLARFTVSSHKPGNGVEQLKSDDLKHFWQ